MTVDAWEQFWIASELSRADEADFAARLNEFEAPQRRRFAYAQGAHALPRADDALTRLLRQRATARAFGTGRLSSPAVGRLLSAFADAHDGRRSWPSAGALYPVEIFVWLQGVDHPLDGRVAHYEPDAHALTDVAAAPAWSALSALLCASALTGTPHVVVLFVLDTSAIEAKYGERGGRFALMEVGHAAQNLALRVAHDGLAGCELGGTHDRELLTVLGLSPATERLALAYACGLPTTTSRRAGRRAPSAWLRGSRASSQ